MMKRTFSTPGVRCARGLTLLELAAVMAVLVILCAIAVPSMATRLRTERLQSAAELLAGDIADARHEAVRRGQALLVEARGGGTPAWCWSVATSAACPCATPAPTAGSAPAPPEAPPVGGASAACRLKTVAAREHTGVSLLQAESVRLNPDGQASPALAAVFSAGERRMHVQVSRFGRTRLCDPEGHSTRVPRC